MIHALATRRIRTSDIVAEMGKVLSVVGRRVPTSVSWCVVVNLELDLFAMAMFHFIFFASNGKKGTLQKIQMMTIRLIFTLIVQIDQKQH